MAKAPKRPEVRVESISRLAADPDNLRVHSKRNLEVIRESIERFGAARSIVADSEGRVLAGSGALEAARAAGIEEVIVVKADGSQLVVVERDLTGDQATAYGIVDNRATDLSAFDFGRLPSALVSLEQSGVDLEPLGWREHELEPLREAASGSYTPQHERDVEPGTAGPVMTFVRISFENRSLLEAATRHLQESGQLGADATLNECVGAVVRHFLASVSP